MILDNLEILNRIDKSELAATYTPAGIIRQIESEGSFNKNISILKMLMSKRVVVVKDGQYAINKHKIKEIMEQ